MQKTQYVLIHNEKGDHLSVSVCQLLSFTAYSFHFIEQLELLN